ncbi:hypothetical protein LINPERHAP2_LOCUS31078, partial [Linum perenne]
MKDFLGKEAEFPRMSDTPTSVIVSVVPQKTVPSVVPATWLCESFLVLHALVRETRHLCIVPSMLSILLSCNMCSQTT